MFGRSSNDLSLRAVNSGTVTKVWGGNTQVRRRLCGKTAVSIPGHTRVATTEPRREQGVQARGPRQKHAPIAEMRGRKTGHLWSPLILLPWSVTRSSRHQRGANRVTSCPPEEKGNRMGSRGGNQAPPPLKNDPFACIFTPCALSLLSHVCRLLRPEQGCISRGEGCCRPPGELWLHPHDGLVAAHNGRKDGLCE